MLASAMAANAAANDVLINGAAAPDNSPTNILVDPGATDDVEVRVNTVDLIGPAGDTIRVNSEGGSGNTLLTIDAGRSVSGATSTGAYVRSGSGNITAIINGDLSSALNGVTLDARFLPLGGDVNLSGTGNLFATGGSAAWLLTDIGSVTMDGFNSIQGGTHGVLVNGSGTINLGTNTPLGAITAGTVGIEVDQLFDAVNNGPITINATDITANNGFGIRTHGRATDTSITVSGIVRSTNASGIFATSTSGNILINGGGTRSVDATGGHGIEADTRFLPLGGNVVISDFDSITSTGYGVWTRADIGTVNIDGIGAITSDLDGVFVESTGDISIGQATALGAINSGGTGILVDQLFDAPNNGSIFVGATDITSVRHGIRTMGSEQFTQISATGAISSGFTGIYATSTTGDIVIDIGSAATVRGGHFGVATETTTGLATVNNSGLIANRADTGAAGDAGALGFRAYSGDTVLNNSGSLIGGIDTSGSTSFTLNNLAGGVWTPSSGTMPFTGANDFISNAGRIDFRDGWTNFNGLETFINERGGHFNMGYGSGATDHVIVNDFSTVGGSEFTFNFDASGANNSGEGYDNSADGLGTADTIMVNGTSTPSGVSRVNVLATGGLPASETGSVSLIYTGVDLDAPTTPVPAAQSSYFTFGSANPTSGTVAYYLVDDGNGGLYLQWGPNVSAASLGPFMGGDLGSSDFAPSGANSMVGRLGTIVGGAGMLGGPSGGGVVGRISDDAAQTLISRNPRCVNGRMRNAWVLGGSAGTSYSPGGHGSTVGFATGIETDLFDPADVECGSTAMGVFFFENAANDRWMDGSSYSVANGLGVYVRAAVEEGYYGSLLGSLAWSDSDLENRVYGSTGNQDNTGYSLVATGGYLRPVAADTFLDLRSFVSYGNVNGRGFTDSLGMNVLGSDADITTLGLMAGLNYSPVDNSNAFARAGLKWFDLDRAVTTPIAQRSGSVDAVVGSVEAGFQLGITQNVWFNAALNTDFGHQFVSGGGRLGLTIGL